MLRFRLASLLAVAVFCGGRQRHVWRGTPSTEDQGHRHRRRRRLDYLYATRTCSGSMYPTARRSWSVDSKEDKVIGEITNTPGVHGFAFANDLKRGFSSNGSANTSSVIDLDSKDAGGKPTFKELMQVKTGGNPDAIMYDAKSGEVWTCNGRANTFTAFEAKTGKIISDGVALGGKPETGADRLCGQPRLHQH